MWGAAPSRLSPRVPTPECRTMSSESCCSADSTYLFRSPRNAALAGDAWTCTATRLLAKARACQRAPWCAAGAQRALMHRWTALASFAALRAQVCSLLELPLEGPGDPTDTLEVPLGELLAGHQPPAPSRL